MPLLTPDEEQPRRRLPRWVPWVLVPLVVVPIAIAGSALVACDISLGPFSYSAGYRQGLAPEVSHSEPHYYLGYGAGGPYPLLSERWHISMGGYYWTLYRDPGPTEAADLRSQLK